MKLKLCILSVFAFTVVHSFAMDDDALRKAVGQRLERASDNIVFYDAIHFADGKSKIVVGDEKGQDGRTFLVKVTNGQIDTEFAKNQNLPWGELDSFLRLKNDILRVNYVDGAKSIELNQDDTFTIILRFRSNVIRNRFSLNGCYLATSRRKF